MTRRGPKTLADRRKRSTSAGDPDAAFCRKVARALRQALDGAWPPGWGEERRHQALARTLAILLIEVSHAHCDERIGYCAARTYLDWLATVEAEVEAEMGTLQ